MKRTMIILLGALLSLHCSAQQDSLLVMFWNLENFFDCRTDGTGDSDIQFTPSGDRRWTRRRFEAKCNAISKLIFKVADEYGRLPDAVGFAEVENADVMKRLLLSTTLRKLDYRIVHFDSHDHRGIDCAMLCRASTFPVRSAEPKHLHDSSGAVMPTRDILLVRSDSLAILVNHHPSKVGNDASGGRDIAMRRMEQICDSLETAGSGRILAIGDFNDSIWPGNGPGTIKYNGKWEKIDGYFQRGLTKVGERVFDDPVLLEKDAAYGGMKPRRTYSGPRYLGGVSDHLPIVLTVYFR